MSGRTGREPTYRDIARIERVNLRLADLDQALSQCGMTKEIAMSRQAIAT